MKSVIDIQSLVIAVAIIGMLAQPAQAASRLGWQSDDSVCELGDILTNSTIKPDDFIRNHCKNGQLLIGTSVAPFGGRFSDVMQLARNFCSIATIQSSRYDYNASGMAVTIEEIRCPIKKLP